MPPLLSLRAATVSPAGQPLFAGLSLSVARGDRICLVGRNGSGKSTLLKALAGLTELDAGERFLQPRTEVAYLPQEPELEPSADALEATLAGLPTGADPASGRPRAEALLAGLGIDPGAAVGALSGGEARRVALARALVGDPDVLLLDEPTNHLDLPTTLRLEQDLAAFRGGLVLVSHDRAFLSALSRTIWWLDRGELRVLGEGFAAFDAWSEAVLAEEEAAQARLDKRIAAETDWSHHGITARRKRNQGRLRRLQALRQERARRSAPVGSARLAAATDPAGGRLVIEADNLGKRFGGRVIVERFSTRILRGDRVGIIGPNGAGKTTLLRLLTGELSPDEGRLRLGTGLTIGRVDQRRASLDLDATPWQTLCPDGGDQVMVQGRFRHVVGYLRDFLFRPEQARMPIRALSGGERNRLLLARQLARPCNLLVLDEPTNDLDMDTLDLLQEVLAEFTGTLAAGQPRPGFSRSPRDQRDRVRGRQRPDAGIRRRLQRLSAPAAKGSAAPPSAPRPAARPRIGPGPARIASRRQRELARVLTEVEALEAEIAGLERELADPDLFRRDPRGLRAARRPAQRAARQPRGRRAALAGSGRAAGRGQPMRPAGPPAIGDHRLLTPAGRPVRVALVHEWLDTCYGSERVLAEILACFPAADLFTLVDVMPAGQRGFLGGRPVRTSFLQRLPFAKRHFRAYLPLMPLAIEQFDLQGYDLVLSSSHAFAKGVLTGPQQLHVAYIHAPMRYGWEYQHQYLRQSGLERGLRGMLVRCLLHYLRLWDYRTANAVDHFIANSEFIARRIDKLYRRPSAVVHPPVDVARFAPQAVKEDYYVALSRFAPYKHTETIVEAFRSLGGRRLVVIGEGPGLERARARAGPNVTLLGFQPFEVLQRHLAAARALIFAAEEDFGIAPVEAQACGTPVIAFAGGGALETVRGLDQPRPTGLFFEAQTAEAIAAAVLRFEREGRAISRRGLPRQRAALQPRAVPQRLPPAGGRGLETPRRPGHGCLGCRLRTARPPVETRPAPVFIPR